MGRPGWPYITEGAWDGKATSRWLLLWGGFGHSLFPRPQVNICPQFGNWTCTTHITTVNVEHCRVSVSQVAAHTLHNVVAVSS